MNEAKMTDADMKQRENIVKSMKKNFKDFRKRYGADAKNVMYATATKMAMKEELQGSSVAKVPYKVMDMDNLVQDAIKDIPEDDGPHTSTIGDMDAINFQTVAKPEDVVNQPNNEGNRESTAVTSARKTGKPFKAIRSRGPGSYGAEDLSGAVASVAIGEAVKDAADKGEYDYEGDMAKSSLRTIVRNAQMMHDMLDENTNLPEWVASKITLAEDYIVAAAQYMQSEMTEEVEQVDEISKELAWKAAHKALEKTRVAAYHSIYGGESGHKRFLKAVRQHKKISDYASAKTPKVPYVKEDVAQIDEYQKGLFNPPAGFTKKGIEKGGGVKTTYHYKGKSNTPSGATMKMGGVTVPLGKTPTKRRVKEEMGLEENQYSLPAGSTKDPNKKYEKPKSALEKRFGHLKPGESASLKGDPKKVMKKTNEEQEQQVETPNGSNN